MSEEILIALTQLFAIISKQDKGVSKQERDYVIRFFQERLDTQTINKYITAYDDYSKTKRKRKSKDSNRVSVVESVRTLALCKRINKTLDQKQKVIVLVKLLEMLNADKNFAPARMAIIQTVADTFNIPAEEHQYIENFVTSEKVIELNYEDLLIFDEAPPPPECDKVKYINSETLNGEVLFLRVKSVGLYFVKYTGTDEILLNGQIIKNNNITLFSPGSILKTPKGSSLFYSDLVTHYTSSEIVSNISYNVANLEYRFPNGVIGLHDINISETGSNLIGIMGASGAGKTTLLNVLAGLEKPWQGSILINGYGLHEQKNDLEGVIGYIAQDDLLIEELTVYQNLYYNAKLCFKELSEEQIETKINETLNNLGLLKIKDLLVGNVFNKMISGGQRKRLNIALEIIREPSILFVDEPTSGLSSRDSENVMDLLKELSLKGKLIFVVIHQPSAEIYKMFDKMYIMDTGGYPCFYGDPIEGIIYFKRQTGDIDSERGQCMTCGNVNTEQIFNIIEAQIVDEFGRFTGKRKVEPIEWNERFQKAFKLNRVEGVQKLPPKTLNIPNKLKQISIFTVRDFLSKISDKQYVSINLLEAPVLAILLAWVIRYIEDGKDKYIFELNENLPAFILMSIVVALFIGLTVSAEEIIKDKKILKRERFLNLSKFSYLVSKLAILFSLSAVQTFSFVVISHLILGIKDMTWAYWAVLFSVSCHANVLGLNISSAFKSVATVYIIIPLLLIPQLMLSGLIFNYDKLNQIVSEKGTVPFVADLMASRWSYEGIAYYQYKNNRYFEHIFELEKQEAQNNFKSSYWVPKLEEFAYEISDALYEQRNDSIDKLIKTKLLVLNNELKKDHYTKPFYEDELKKLLEYETISQESIRRLLKIISKTSEFYNTRFALVNEKKDSVLHQIQQQLPENVNLSTFREEYYNESLAEIVKNSKTSKRIAVHSNELLQIIDPIYNEPHETQALNYRTHFFAPKKTMFHTYFNTFSFNIAAIWFMTFLLIITLYFDFLPKLVSRIGESFQFKSKKT